MAQRAGQVGVGDLNELQQVVLDLYFVVPAAHAEARRRFERVAARVVEPADECFEVPGHVRVCV